MSEETKEAVKEQAKAEPNDGRIRFFKNPDGTMTFVKPNGEKATFQNPRTKVLEDDLALTGAQRRLARLRRGETKADENLYEKLEWEDETVYVKRLRFSECTRVHLTASRNGDGHLDITDSADELRSFTIAVLEGCIWADEQGEQKYFTLQDAAVYADSTDADTIRFVRALFNLSLHYNRELVPLVVGAAIPIPTMKSNTNGNVNETSAAPNSTSEISTPSTLIPGTNGSSDTLSSDKPVTSPDA